VYSTQPSWRQKLTSLMPASAEMSIASVLGAEMVASIGMFMRAAGHKDKTAPHVHAVQHQVTDQLVERVVASHVLAHTQHGAAGVAPRGRMHAAGGAHQFLVLTQFSGRARDRRLQRGLVVQRRRIDTGRLQVQQLQALDAAHPATTAPSHRAALLLELDEFLAGDGDLDFKAARMLPHLYVEYVGALGHQALGQRETQRKRLQLARRDHHDGMRDAIENQRHRQFLGDAVGGAVSLEATTAQHLALLKSSSIRLNIELHNGPAE